MDVEPGAGQRGRDLAQHVRHVGVGDRQAEGRFARHGDVGEVHRVRDVAVLKIVGDLLGDHDRAVFLGLLGRGAEVRQRHEARVLTEQVAGEVADVGVQASLVQAGQCGALVDDALARKVEQHAALFHQRDAFGIDEVLGRRQERHVQADEVGALDEVVDAGRLAHLRRQAPGGFDGDFRVVADDLHAQRDRRFGELRADGAEADDAQRAAAQFVPDEIFLAGFDLLVQRLVVAAQAADEGQRRGEVARADEHAGDDQLLDRVGVGAGRVEDDDAAFAHRLDWNVVGAGAGAADGQDAVGDGQFVHRLRADEDGVGRGGVVADRIRLGQAGEAFARDGVERLDRARHTGSLGIVR